MGECEDSIIVERLLSFITYIGVAFSLLGLLISIVTMLGFRYDIMGVDRGRGVLPLRG